MREIADAPSPMGVNLKTQASDLHGHALRGAIFAGQPLRPDTTYEVLQLIEYQTVPISLAPDLLPLEQLLALVTSGRIATRCSMSEAHR